MTKSIHRPVKKALIAAAGFGTRFLPQTKAMPKEMLPLIDKPIIQHIVEELVEAGITDIAIVTGYHKRSIEDHFDGMSSDLRNNLETNNKDSLLEATDKISNMANFSYIRQKGPYGNATPLLNAEHVLNNEPFIYTFADDFIDSKPSRFKQMIDAYAEHGTSILPCIEVSNDEDYDRYGIVSGTKAKNGQYRVETIIEKPGKKKAPSNLASVTGFLFTPDIFKYLHKSNPNQAQKKEFIVQVAMQDMINDGHSMIALKIKNGKYYDTGNKLEYLKTLVDFGLKRKDIQKDFKEYLQEVIQ
jgi:UTP--glucose-1-phosphate uridylyltransferase